MHPLFITLRAVVVASGFVWFWSYVALWTQRFDPLLGIALPAWTAPLGSVAIFCGAVLALTCVGLFVVRGRGTPAPFDPPRAFVAVGPYAKVRNPMYIGGWLALAGLGLWERSAAMVLFSLLWVGAAHVLVVAYEERTLRKTFDGSYERYLQSVPRWMPTIRRSDQPMHFVSTSMTDGSGANRRS
jgi:protein-S-isoprenylcysteine O-methyltransferase Ste14